MKAWQTFVIMITLPAAIVYGATLVGNLWLKSKEADRYEEKQRHDKCLAARVLFFEHCLKLDQRAECETMWSEKRGLVFDGEAEKPWTDEVDCSKEIK